MADEVLINNLRLRCIIGINPEERVNRQDVVINVRVRNDNRPAARSDAIEDAVNYRSIAKDVIELVEGSEFLLVERMAEEVARTALKDPKAEGVAVEVLKPGAVRFADSVGVRIERSRADFERGEA